MPRIPIIEQTVGVSVTTPMPRAQGAEVANPFSTLGKVQEGLQSIERADDIRQQADVAEQRVLRHQEEEAGKAYANRATSDTQIQWLQNLQKAQESAAPGAPDFAGNFLKSFDEYAKTTIEQAPTAASKKYITQHMDVMRSQFFNHALTFEAKARSDFNNDTFSKSTQARAQTLAAAPTEENLQVQLNALKELNPAGTPQERSARIDLAEKTLRTAAWAALVQKDPAGAKAMIDKVFDLQRKASAPPSGGPASAGGFDAVMPFIFKEEGGYAASDGKSGAPVNFGINQRANPDIDVKNLTKDQAAQIYRDRYWNAIGADRLSPAAQLVAMDAAVNQGVGFAKQIIAQTGGDPQAMIALRRERYAMLAEDSAMRKYAGTWERRMQNVEKAIGGMGTAPVGAPDLPPDARIPTNSTLVSMTPISELLHWQNAAESQIGQNAQTMQTQLRLDVQNAEAQAAQGVAPTGPSRTLAEFQAAFKDGVVAQSEFERYVAARKTGEAVATFNARPTNELLAVVNAPPPAAENPAFATLAKNQDIQARAAAQVIQARQKDPWGYALATKDFGAQPLDPSAPTFGAALAQRAAALPGMVAKYGVNAGLLSAPEAKLLSDRLDNLPGAAKVQMLQTMRANVADTNVYLEMMNSIRKDSPVTAMVGAIAADPGSVVLGGQAVDKTEVARRIAVGEDLLNKTKGDASKDGNRGGFPMPKEDQLRQAFNDYVGDSYHGFPNEYATAYEAFRAYYAERAAAKGLVDAKAGVDSKIADEAAVAASGGTTAWGSFGSRTKVLMPYGMPADEFKDKVAGTWARVSADNGLKIDVGSIGLMPTGRNGEYMAMSGTSYIPGKDGKPIIMDITRYSYPSAPKPAAKPPSNVSTGVIR